VSFDRPRNSDVPHIDPADPLPVPLKPKGRWGEPYQSDDGKWRACLRRGLTRDEESEGLLQVVIADDLEILAQLQQQQDDLFKRVSTLRVYTIRNSGS
jgi:hypothetical protein